MVGNKSTDQIPKFPKNVQQNNSDTVTNTNDKETPKARYISTDKRQENFDDLRLYNNKIMEYQKTAEPTGDLIGNKIDVKFTKVSRSSPQNNSEAITNNHEKEIPKERYISPEEVQKIDLK